MPLLLFLPSSLPTSLGLRVLILLGHPHPLRLSWAVPNLLIPPEHPCPFRASSGILSILVPTQSILVPPSSFCPPHWLCAHLFMHLRPKLISIPFLPQHPCPCVTVPVLPHRSSCGGQGDSGSGWRLRPEPWPRELVEPRDEALPVVEQPWARKEGLL